MADSSAILSVMGTSFAVMAKISIVSAVGYCCAIFPSKDPLLPVSALRYLSRLSNIIFLPCLIVVSLGSSLNLGLLTRIGAFLNFFFIEFFSYCFIIFCAIGIVMPYCAIINTLSYLIAHTIGRFLHEQNPDDEIDRLFIASAVAIVRFYKEDFLIL